MERRELSGAIGRSSQVQQVQMDAGSGMLSLRLNDGAWHDSVPIQKRSRARLPKEPAASSLFQEGNVNRSALTRTLPWFISLMLILPSLSYSALRQQGTTIHTGLDEWTVASEPAEPFIATEGPPWCSVQPKHQRSTELFDRALYSLTLITSANTGLKPLATSDSDPFRDDQLLELLRSFECRDR